VVRKDEGLTMFDPKKKDQIDLAYTLYDGRLTDFYRSPKYNNAVSRYEYRRNMYYRKPMGDVAKLRSQLYFPVFYLACQAFEAQIKAKENDTFVNITMKNIGKKDEAIVQKEATYNYDLNHDLEISDFKSAKSKIHWYLKIFGCGVGREDWTREVSTITRREVMTTPNGQESINQIEDVTSKEHTKTTAIHPLNHAHMLNRGDFKESSWGSVRYEMDIAELVMLKSHPGAIAKNIDEAIADIEDGRSGWSSNNLTFYADDQQVGSGSAQYHQTIVVDEISGDMHFKGNSADSSLYLGIMDRKRSKWLMIGKSPYKRHPYWKVRTYPDPAGPYGVDPCGVMVSINVMKNTFFNRYMDWTDANLKFMYEVFPKNIKGGASALVNGVPGGYLEAIDEKTWLAGPMIRPVNKDKNGIPGINDVLSYIEKAEVQSAVVSDQRNKVKGNETATQSMEIAKKGDDSISSILDDVDQGFKDCMYLKMSNRIAFSMDSIKEQVDKKNSDSPPIRYFPFELSEDEIDITINRIDGSAEANKALVFIGKVNEAMQMTGGKLDPAGVISLYRRIGRDIGMGEEIEQLLQPIPKPMQPQQPSQVPGAAPELLGQPQPQPTQQGPVNAAALA
jgi:hypothetical protein